MNNKKFLASIWLIGFTIFLNSYTLAQDSNASDFQDTEDKIKRFEIGGQITALRQKSFNENSPVFDADFAVGGRFPRPSDGVQTEFGFGGRFTYNFNKNVGVDVEANYFPIDRLARDGRETARIFNTDEFVRVFVEPKGRKFQLLAGPKIGIRKKKFGVFGKVRPGFFQVERYPIVDEIRFSPPAFIASGDQRKTFFSVDVGAVFEYYPSKRAVLRFDVGDTIIRYRALEPKEFNPGFTRHSLQTSVGFGFRF